MDFALERGHLDRSDGYIEIRPMLRFLTWRYLDDAAREYRRRTAA